MYQCDQSLPSCSRCTRLRIKCVGAGERRFKFVEDGASARSSSNSRSPPKDQSSATTRKDSRKSLSRSPSNETTTLTVALIDKFKDPSDIKYHLVWAYGDFLEEIPRRIGTSEALDTSVAALVSAHSNLSSRSPHITVPESLSKYNTALKSLRTTLNDVRKASQPETLCACYLLLICQAFFDAHDCGSSTHTEGATQILKARGYFYPKDDEFEQKLLMSLRGPVLMEALLNDRITFNFTREEWMDLVQSKFDSPTREGRMMHCWAQMPDLMRRGKMALNGSKDLYTVATEARIQYDILAGIVSEFRERYHQIHQNRPVFKSPIITPERLCNHYQRMYGLVLAICLISNCIISALDTANARLKVESIDMCKQVLVLADLASVYRPLGSGYITLCLQAAWCSCTDTAMKATLEETLADYLGDWSRGTEPVAVRESLASMSRRLRLES